MRRKRASAQMEALVLEHDMKGARLFARQYCLFADKAECDLLVTRGLLDDVE